MAKRQFSIGEALGEGFRLAKQRPLSVWVWGLIVLLPNLAPMALMIDPMLDLPLADMGGEADMAHNDAFLNLMVQSQLANALSTALQMIGWAVLGAAVYRAVLKPGVANRRPFALGFGMDELRVGVTYLALVVGAVVLMIGLLLVVAGVGVAMWPQLTETGQALAASGLMFVTLMVLLAAYARVCLIPPVCIARGDFTFEEGWRLGAGQTGKLALMTLATWLLTLVVALMAYAVLAAIGAAVWFGLGLSVSWPEDPASFREMIPEDPRVLWLFAVLMIPLTWVYGLTTVIGLAPYASAVKQLTPAHAADAPVSAEPSDS